MEKKYKKISLPIYIISLIILLLIVGGMAFYIIKENNKNNSDKLNTNINANETNMQEKNNTENNTIINEGKNKNYFILYDGYKMENKIGIQDLSDMEVNEENNKIYNTTYYNYEKGKYLGETKGDFGEQTYEGVSVVSNVKRIAISEKYNAIPREYKVIEELPNELIDMADYTKVTINSIDLDGNNEEEYLLCYCINYAKGEFGDGEPAASSGIMLLDNNYKKIANLVELKNGFWANIKEEDKKVFLSLDDVEYIDIDNDNIMEIIIKIPTYEGTKLSILKYKNNKIDGETNFQASVMP